VTDNPLHALLWLARVLLEPSGSDAATLTRPRSRWAKLGDWLRRYGPAECGGIAGAVVGSFLVRRLTGSALAAAYGGAWGETLGYAAVMLARDIIEESRIAHSARGAFRIWDIGRVLTGLLAEFGPAGALDSFVTRPLAMGLGVRAFGLGLGIVVGKVAADLVFYVPVILIYEYRRRGRRSGSADAPHHR
jgi:hypothetical protein